MKQQNTYFKANTLADPFERQISSWLLRHISMRKESLFVLFVNWWAKCRLPSTDASDFLRIDCHSVLLLFSVGVSPMKF
jgi:hypothetical protein